MSIGLIGKENGVRLITGSINYGNLRKERINIANRLDMQFQGRRIMSLGHTVIFNIDKVKKAKCNYRGQKNGTF